MAQPTGAYSQYDANNINEDLEQIIFNVDPFDTPFISKVAGKKKVKAIRHDWLTENLKAVDPNNAVIEGDDATLETSQPTVRVSNVTQIMDKTVVVTGTHEAVDSAGYKSALAHQLMLRGRELRRDAESIMLRNQASVLGDDTTARRLGGLPSWLVTNTARAAGGADGGFSQTTQLTVAATDATTGLRTFSQTLLIEAHQSAFENGGSPDILLMSPFQKTKFIDPALFPGTAELRSNVSQGAAAKIVNNVEVYVGPFGQLKVMVDRWQRSRDVYLLDAEYLSIGTLRPLQQYELAKSGDSHKRQMLQEVTLIVENQQAHAVIADLLTS